MKVILVGVLQSGKCQRLAIDPDWLRTRKEMGEVIKNSPEVGQDSEATRQQMYRGNALDKQYLN